MRLAWTLGLAILWAATFAAAPAQHFQFAILGDRTGEAQPGIYEAVWKQIERFRPAFVLNVGDSIEGGHDASARAEWRAVKSVWTKLPVYLVPGNHDIWSAASERIWREETGHPPFYSFDYEDAHFCMLDNSRSEDLTPEQYRFLESDLAANERKHPKVIVFHRPLWLIPVLLQNHAFPLHLLVKRYGVDAVLSGHVHNLSRHKLDGVDYIMAGSSGGHIDRGLKAGQGEKEGWFFQWMEADVDGPKITFEPHKVN